MSGLETARVPAANLGEVADELLEAAIIQERAVALECVDGGSTCKQKEPFAVEAASTERLLDVVRHTIVYSAVAETCNRRKGATIENPPRP